MRRYAGIFTIFVAASLLGAVLVPIFGCAREKTRSSPSARSDDNRASEMDVPGGAQGGGAFAPGSPSSGLRKANSAEGKVKKSPEFGGGYPGAGGVPQQYQQYGAQRLPQPTAPPPATQNPSLYIGSTYSGGSGERDRLEKLITNGVLVDGKRVKLEAFSRDYDQAFPIPTREALTVVADTERTKIIEDGDRTFLQVGLQAMKGEMPRRPPLNIALVLDRSGSMNSENKMEHARNAALDLVNRLRPGDVLSVVAFDDHAELLTTAQRVTAETKEKARQRIKSLTPGSGTNIYAGLQLGYQEARKNAARPGGVSLVLLLSDGEVTAGVSDPARFQSLAAAHVEEDIQTTSVGVGVAFNEDLMLSIAREGKGNYHFLRDGADTTKVFAKELDELTHIVAKAVRLRIRLADGVGLVRVLGAQTLDAAQTRAVKADERRIDRRIADELGIRQDRQKVKEEPGIKMVIPHFYRGDSHIVMLEIQVPKGRGTRKLADVSVKYKDLVRKTNRETVAVSRITYTPRRSEMIASLNRSVKKNLLGFQTGEALARAGNLLGQGQVAEAMRCIDERMAVLGVAAQQWNDRDLDRDGRLLARYKIVVAQLNRNPQLARADLGEYLQKSLTYSGYQRTR